MVRVALLLVLLAANAFAQSGPAQPDPGPPLPSQPPPGPPPPHPPQQPPPQQPPPQQPQPPPPGPGAQPRTTEVAPPPPSTENKLFVGPQLDLMPIGTIHAATLGTSASNDTATAVGLGGLLEYRVHPIFTVGVAPRFVLPVKEDGSDMESGSQFDLRARVTAGGNITPLIRLQGVFSLGYSWIFHLVMENGQYRTSAGFIFGFGAGITYALRPRFLLVGELGYQLGYQGTDVGAIRVKIDDDYLTLGVGFVVPIL